MITPRFNITQNESQLMISIHAPYTNVKNTEIHVHETDFRFHSSPYYLRLTLPGEVAETDNSSAKYYEETRSFEIILDKVSPGQHFEGLDMLTKMMQPSSARKVVATKPLIEVMPDESRMEQDDAINCEFEEDEWFSEQKLPEVNAVSSLLHQHGYGFANGHKGLNENYDAELGEVSQIQNPDKVSPAERRCKRLKEEKEKFSDDHYLSDLLENDDVQDIIAFKVNFNKFSKLSDSDKERLKNLPNREFVLDKTWQKKISLGLFDILFAYVYDAKITRGSHCAETHWNISRISSTLSWFDTFDTVDELVYSCVRRSLVYPYYRHWELSITCLHDTIQLFRKGTTCLLKCLVDMYAIFAKRDPYYILNQLYIEEYCVWIQTKSSGDFDSMLDAMAKAAQTLEKGSVDLDLVELEAAGLSLQDEEMEDAISSRISRVAL